MGRAGEAGGLRVRNVHHQASCGLLYVGHRDHALQRTEYTVPEGPHARAGRRLSQTGARNWLLLLARRLLVASPEWHPHQPARQRGLSAGDPRPDGFHETAVARIAHQLRPDRLLLFRRSGRGVDRFCVEPPAEPGDHPRRDGDAGAIHSRRSARGRLGRQPDDGDGMAVETDERRLQIGDPTHRDHDRDARQGRQPVAEYRTEARRRDPDRTGVAAA